MHPNRRRKKRPNYGIKTVEVMRGPNGFGFTISGQQPCILSCIVANSPADQAGLRAGDFLISVNGTSVSKITHDAVVSLIGNCIGPIKMTIAENYFSDSSDEELECSRMVTTRKPKYTHKPRVRKEVNRVELKNVSKQMTANLPDRAGCNYTAPVPERHFNIPMEDEAGPIEYKALVGYLGTIEMPKQLLPNSRLQTVCSCIRKLRQEKRAPTAILMTILPTCLTLKNSANQILAIYPTSRVVYVGSTADKESRYFGLVTTAVSETRFHDNNDNAWNSADKKNINESIEISNSCHVFVIDPKIIDHTAHQSRAENFKITCTRNTVNGYCMEFPGSALYVVSLIQNMYKLQNGDKAGENFGPLVANSPQPSASSNSDSGIGFRDDCGNISDRILVVEFPQHRPFPLQSNVNRPLGIDAANLPLEGLDMPFENSQQNVFSRAEPQCVDNKLLNNLNNIRACETKPESNSIIENIKPKVCVKVSDSSDDNTQRIEEGFRERAIDCPDSPQKLSVKEFATNLDSKSGSFDDISMHSSKSNELSNLLSIFKVPFETKKHKKHLKVSSCDNLDKCNRNLIHHKLSPKVYGLKPNYSCEELNNLENNFDVGDKLGYGSLQDLSYHEHRKVQKNILSDPDVRIEQQEEESCDDQNFVKCNYSEGPSVWAGSFEKLLADPLGLHMFAEFLKKEFSAENIYFWIACERFKVLTSENDRRNEAQRIYRQHLCGGAAEAVNVDAQARQSVERNLHSADLDLFAQAQKQIFNLMKFDSYPRFLRSDIYRKCLSGEEDKIQIDVRLILQPISTPTKLKKSVSNAEDRRRKSLLPWHRKNRSKSKDRGESEYNKRGSDPSSGDLKNIDPSEVHSSGSSLTSLDIAVSSQCVNVEESSMTLAGCEVTVEQRVVFKLDLPNRKMISIRSKYTKIITDVLRPSLHKYQYNLDQMVVLNGNTPIDLHQPVTTIDGFRLKVQYKEDFRQENPNVPIKNNKVKLEEITNKVYEGILQEKCESLSCKLTKSDRGSVKSEDWGSEHSSTFIGKFLRRDSGIHERKKKIPTRFKEETMSDQSQMKKPLIAKLKCGANKFNLVPSSESDELVEGLTRAQRRIEDQRGTEINSELPDFLKDKENEHLQKQRRSDLEGSTAKFYLGETSVPASSDKLPVISSAKNMKLELQSNYENRNVLVGSKYQDSRYDIKSSPSKSEGVQSTTSPVKSTITSVDRMEPPPLPPKPKVMPIKPPNWGQVNGFYKSKDIPSTDRKQAMFLEQSSSSFV
ncbi:regulator of G-protein signaling loco isoform X2 [Diabrotica virgifera virgifera]|uniref:Regulator of G-protein signaling loco n=1 Tax=Diabrotica virgifera virgifera TaxID=50390 RepID=A0ABM5KK97_DIAVI|nr:regulator of G-protein signaling loco isoform X2 [Diabrotica virgifera virgifera]